MKEIILIKLGEIVLKGLNRQSFEFALIRNLRRRLEPLGKFDIREAQSTIYVEPLEDGIDLEAAAERVGKMFGVIAFSRACMAEKEHGQHPEDRGGLPARPAEHASPAFKVESKRSDKHFPLKSPGDLRGGRRIPVAAVPQPARRRAQPRPGGAGGNPRLRRVYPREALPGAGGIPVGTGGKAAILISGGIDSPVAAWHDGPARPGTDGCPFCQPALHQRARGAEGGRPAAKGQRIRGPDVYVYGAVCPGCRKRSGTNAPRSTSP